MIAFAFTALLLGGAPALAVEVPTADNGHAQNPVWSSGGDYLAFEINNMDTTVELWMVPIEGGQPGAPKQLQIPGAGGTFGGGSVAVAPVWFGDQEEMVIFEGVVAGGDSRLYYSYTTRGTPQEFPYTSTLTGNLTFPAVSKDFKRLAVVSDMTGAGDVYVWDSGTGKIAPIFESSSPEHFPAFAPDHKSLVFSRKHNSTEDLFLWSGGTTTPPLLGGDGDQTRPIWTGDKILYFTSERGDKQWDIVASGTTAGSPRTVLAQGVRLPIRAAPAVTPDGKAVAYVSDDPAASGSIRIARLDGSNTAEIPTGLVACGEPSFVQSGGRTWMAFTALPSAGSDWRRLHIIDVTGKY
jgi:Tol biopolymer transport system component